MTGRKPKYSSAAEKQAAYRARKNQNVTPGVLRNCPHCQKEPTEITGMGLDLASISEAHGGRSYICTHCWHFTSVIPGHEPYTCQLYARVPTAFYGRARAKQDE